MARTPIHGAVKFSRTSLTLARKESGKENSARPQTQRNPGAAPGRHDNPECSRFKRRAPANSARRGFSLRP